MANTVTYWKNLIGDAYIAQETIRTLYDISPDEVEQGFDGIFSKVSVESILFYVVAFALHTFELLLESTKNTIQAIVDKAFVANKAWWHAQALKYQDGDNLQLNNTTYQYEYAELNASKQIIKKVAIRESVAADGVCRVKIYVATESAGAIMPLNADELTRFEEYAQMISPTGVLRQIITGDGDVVTFGFTVYYNPLLMSSSGNLISDNTKPAEIAVANYINTLNDVSFGGKLNLTRATDAVQNAIGVVDVKLTSFTVNGVVKDLSALTYDSTNGWFSLGDMTGKITYQPQSELA